MGRSRIEEKYGNKDGMGSQLDTDRSERKYLPANVMQFFSS